VFYFQIGLCDTFVNNQGCWDGTLNSPGAVTMADTGDKWDSSYINFNYRFNTDPVTLKGTKDSIYLSASGDTLHAPADTIFHYGPRPGYAGFKIFWDRGFVAFDARTYDSMYFVHKGLLPGHKVKMIWGQGGQCGGPILYEEMGEFKPSATWTKTTVPFPQLRGNYPQNKFPDSPFVKVGIFELRMLVYDDSSVTTSPTSAQGNLKIDNIGFIRKNSGISNSMRVSRAVGNSRFFVPTASGKVTLGIYSLQGGCLFKGLVGVAAGKRYNVAQFARSNSKLAAGSIHCVQISGPGVNITETAY
jgi:hypothetical protein